VRDYNSGKLGGAIQPDSHASGCLVRNVSLICATGGGGHPTGVAAGNGADLAARDITFSRNTIQSATCQ
jgi:hypothetical protein